MSFLNCKSFINTVLLMVILVIRKKYDRRLVDDSMKSQKDWLRKHWIIVIEHSPINGLC